jgi:hypothetical protein
MPGIGLVIGIVAFPIIVGAFITIASYKYYQSRYTPAPDLEQAQHPNTNQFIPPHNLDSSRTHPNWTREHIDTIITPFTKSLPNPKPDIKGIGGGFVNHITRSLDFTNSSHPGSGVNNPSPYPDLGTNVSAPEKVYTSASYGRYSSMIGPAIELSGGGFEDIVLDDELSGGNRDRGFSIGSEKGGGNNRFDGGEKGGTGFRGNIMDKGKDVRKGSLIGSLYSR